MQCGGLELALSVRTQAAWTGARDYEGLAELVGGRAWRAATQGSILVLMAGSLVGGIQQASSQAAQGPGVPAPDPALTVICRWGKPCSSPSPL